MDYKEASYYNVLDEDKSIVQCGLCPNNCVISDGKTGSCRVRKNISGKLFCLNYGKLVSASTDPVEKKPIFHFMPGSMTFSIATVGCNLHCKFCQNYQISQSDEIFGEKYSPEMVVSMAKKHGLESISYTYTEPTIFFEFMLDTAKLAKRTGMKNIVISNGYINREPLRELAKFVDAVNIDLKSMEDSFYRKYCGVSAGVSPVLDTIQYLVSAGVHVEVTNLVIEPLNSSEKLIRSLCKEICSISPDIPLHFSSFCPVYKMIEGFNVTNRDVLLKARKIAISEGLKYVYLGNISAENNTYCGGCGKMLVKRYGSDVKVFYGAAHVPVCPECGKKVPIIGFE